MNTFIKNIAAACTIAAITATTTLVYNAHDTYATKDDVLGHIIEIRLHLTTASISRMHDVGVAKFTDKQMHEYNTLVDSEKMLIEQKAILDGFNVQ